MVGYYADAASPTCTVYVDVTLTGSKVKVNLSGLLSFRQLFSGAFWLLLGHRLGDDLIDLLFEVVSVLRPSVRPSVPVRDATVTWLGTLLVLHVLYMLT